MPNLRIRARGLDSALRSAREIPLELIDALDDETERAALRVINDARENAPRLDGLLKNSIRIYPPENGRPRRMARTIGSDRPYAARQEYEHATKRGFFRKALYKERNVFRAAIERVLRRAGD